jgi:hypothetical protein
MESSLSSGTVRADFERGLSRQTSSSASKKARRPSIRQAYFGDYEQIAAAEAASGLTPRSREEWLHLWQDNPAYQSLRDWPIGWVLEDDGGRIVGSIGNIPLLFHLGGSTYLGATFCGWAVDPKYRAFSLMLVAHQLQHRSVDFHMVTTAKPVSEAVFTSLGWTRAPVGQWNRSAFWVTNYSGAVRRYLAQNVPRGVFAVVARLLAGPLLLADLCARQERKVKSPYELRWSTRFDERFEGFWTELQQRSPELFLSSRTRGTLEWHFKYAVRQNRIWVLTVWEGPRLVAYGIFERRDGRAVDLTRIFIVDLQMLGRNPGLASVMISHALSRCRRERIHVLENAGCWLEALQLTAKRPPYHRRLESWGYLYQCRNPRLASVLQSAKSWYPTQLDGDSSL